MCRDNEDKQEGNATRAIPKEKNKFFQTPARRPRWDVKLGFLFTGNRKAGILQQNYFNQKELW